MSQLIRVIDCETTGLDPLTDRIVEVASVDVLCYADGRSSLVEHNTALINPGIPIPPEASAVHHLTDKDVATAMSYDTIQPCLRDGAPDVFAAHNAAFDRAFTRLDGNWICTRKVAMYAYPDLTSWSNQVLRYALRLEVPQECLAIMPHRALHDALVTATMLQHFLDRFTVREMLDISSKPCLLPRVSFGKHRGQKWSDIPKDYLRWCLGQDMDEDVKHTAHHWLAN